MSELFDRDIDADQAMCEAASPRHEWARGRTTLTAHDSASGEALVCYDDGGCCAVVHDDLGMGCVAYDYARFFAAAREGWPACIGEVRRLRGVIEQHGLCHDLHGRVGPEDFAAGCEAEQRRIYGQAPHADEIARLRAEVASLKVRLTRALQDLEAANDQH